MERRLGPKLTIRSLMKARTALCFPYNSRRPILWSEPQLSHDRTGETGDFIDQDFVENTKLPTWKLSRPIPVYNVHGTPNEAGSIDKVVDVIMTYKGHSERILLAVTQLGKQSMILGSLGSKNITRRSVPTCPLCQNVPMPTLMLHWLSD